jgi:hypothetical protein
MLYLIYLNPGKDILGPKTGRKSQKAGKTDNFAAQTVKKQI